MATTFNFTVRAEDDQGAFADRDFSMTVRNTMVDRYMVIDATDAYTSPDMVTWTKRIGQGGAHLMYGGGKWLIPIVYNGLQYRLSTDGVNFTTHTIPTTGYGTTVLLHCPVWNNDRWWVAFQGQETGVYYNIVLNSIDGVNWSTVARTPATNNTFAAQTLPTFSEGKAFYTSGNTSKYCVVEGDTITSVTPTLPAHSVGTPFYTAPMKINDLWVMVVYGTSGTMSLYSTDRNVWNAGPVLANGNLAARRLDSISYHNGKLICSGFLSSVNNFSLNCVASIDGKTWTNFTPVSSAGAVKDTRQYVISTKGKIYLVNSTNKYSSSNLGETWTNETATFPSVSITGFATIQ